MVRLGSLVLFSGDAPATIAFYRALGIPLEHEQHDDGEVHAAVELGDVHVAVYSATQGSGRAPARRAGGSTFPGVFVDSLDDVQAALTALGARVLGSHEQMPWGCRFVVEDPNGRPVEVNQTGHCP